VNFHLKHNEALGKPLFIIIILGFFAIEKPVKSGGVIYKI